jgi:hypothetical protein
MTAKNRDTLRRQIRRLRVDRRTGRGQPFAYLGESEEDTEVQGDDEAPWLKNPPFVTETTIEYQHGVELGDEFQDLPAIEVRQERTLLLWFMYMPAVTARLRIVLEAQRQDGTFVPTAVVDATLNPLAGLSAARDVFASEIRTPFLGGGSINMLCVPFDVSPYRVVRFRVAEELQEEGDNGVADFEIDLNV